MVTQKKAPPKDLPREQLAAVAEKALASGGRSKVYFKFTCRHCGTRCTFAEPNVLFEVGECNAGGKPSPVDEGGFMMVLEMPHTAGVQLAEEGD